MNLSKSDENETTHSYAQIAKAIKAPQEFQSKSIKTRGPDFKAA